MEILDAFLSQRPGNDRYFPRKLRLPDEGNFALSGPRGCGKTATVLDWLSRREEPSLYLDAQDPLFALEDIDVEELEGFLAEEEIETVVIDHWYDGFLERLPRGVRVVLVGRLPPDPKLGLERLRLHPLDFEEFLAFDRSHSPTQSFDRFLRLGTLPAVSRSSIPSAPLRLRELFFEKFDEAESRLLLILARFQGRRATTHQLYTVARDYFRISKDWTYRTIARFEEEEVLLRLENLGPASGKKVYLYDFVLSRYLNKFQPFAVTFDSMVVLALHKHRIPFGAYGNLGYRLLEEDTLIVSIPFEGEEQFWKRAQGRYGEFHKSGAKKVVAVTVSNRFDFTVGEIRFEGLPFYEWSVLNE
ncbi:hypothetical protein [Nitratifractor sp.]